MITMLVITIGPAANVYADKAKELDAAADAALDRFYNQVKGGREVAEKAKGLMADLSIKGAKFNKLEL